MFSSQNHAAVLAGAGLSVLPDYLVVADLAAGRLRHVLPEWKLRSGGIHVVLPSVRFRSAKVSRFLELLSDAETKRRKRAQRALDQHSPALRGSAGV